MTPVALLKREHATTRRMLDVLLALARRVEAGADFPSGDAAAILSFFREFVEQVHHRRENLVIYPFAAMVGGEESAEIVGQLMADHDETKLLMHSLTVFWEPNGLLPDERRSFAEVARTYANRLLKHMEIEERVLFPVATDIPGDEAIRLVGEFERIGVDRRSCEDWVVELERLEAEYID
ncbi:MAG: hemerythrin domain-containing protein [Planctomycetes bacterium]|nr:hemerythrin domain-containing protein [Planctomycetota bacterium]